MSWSAPDTSATLAHRVAQLLKERLGTSGAPSPPSRTIDIESVRVAVPPHAAPIAIAEILAAAISPAIRDRR
jgi:hypothetical protein